MAVWWLPDDPKDWPNIRTELPKKGLENSYIDFKNGVILPKCTVDRQTTKLHFYEAAYGCVQPKNSIQKEMVVKTNILVYELDSSNWQWNIVYFSCEF